MSSKVTQLSGEDAEKINEESCSPKTDMTVAVNIENVLDATLDKGYSIYSQEYQAHEISDVLLKDINPSITSTSLESNRFSKNSGENLHCLEVSKGNDVHVDSDQVILTELKPIPFNRLENPDEHLEDHYTCLNLEQGCQTNTEPGDLFINTELNSVAQTVEGSIEADPFFHTNDICDDSEKDPDYVINSESAENAMSNLPRKNITNQISADKNEVEAQKQITPLAQNQPSFKQKKHNKGDTRKSRSTRKQLRNEGKEYITKSGKVKAAKKCRDLPVCRMKCREKVQPSRRTELFLEFWGIGNHDKQVQYISGLISGQEKSSSRKKVDNKGKRKNRMTTYHYSLILNGQREQVCKKCFMIVFDVTNRFITEVLKNRNASTSGIVHSDMRGKSSPYNKISEENMDLVRTHISMIPTYESHYTRRDSSRKYIPSYYTLKRLYEEYKIWLPPEKKPVSQTVYEREFIKTGIKIKKPYKDTCATCDKIQMLIRNSSEPNKGKLREELELHQTEADNAYRCKKNDKDEAERDPSKLVYTFDLQQCLPTPDIKTSVAFYKRQLWTYNFTMHRCKDKQCFCFMWHECIAGRGANQIGSCLYNHLEYIPDEISEITLYSDTCGGQNKNSYILIMFSLVMKKNPHVKCINHKFLVPGHTHMECDSDHSVIEKKKKKSEFSIDHPRDWIQLVRTCGTKQCFIVKEMKREEFFEFSSLFKKYFQNRKVNEEGERVIWKNIKWFKYTQNIGLIEYKTTLAKEDPFKTINLLRKTPPLPHVMSVPLSYKGPVPITTEKKKNLIELLPYIDETFHEFYKNLPTKQGLVDTLYGYSEDEEDE